jgi:DNA uptake protein ComE-like DNA-binding protein
MVLRTRFDRDRSVMAAAAAGLAVLVLAAQPVETAGPLEPVPDLKINLNTAPPQVLTILPSVGDAMVAKLLQARDEQAFESLGDVDRRVRGVGPRTVELWQPWVRFDQDDQNPPAQRNR